MYPPKIYVIPYYRAIGSSRAEPDTCDAIHGLRDEHGRLLVIRVVHPVMPRTSDQHNLAAVGTRLNLTVRAVLRLSLVALKLAYAGDHQHSIGRTAVAAFEGLSGRSPFRHLS